jgi:FlaA1/EpsC-like NDP-sugar epimerase
MLNGKEILITGGTGSLGKTLLKILATEYQPKGIRIFSRDELKQWELQNEIKKWNTNIPIAFLLGDVRDKERLERACQHVDIVINCAAMKQVPSCESNPFEAIETNIIGAKNLINACIDNGVQACMHVSTDKAVYPVNLYGKTKAVAESLFIYGNTYSGNNGTKFNVCRYGNVLGSRGSIIPLFREQAKSGMITLTDGKMTRFWITLDAVARFIIERFTFNGREAGSIFIPKMPTAKVFDIAQVVAPEAEILLTGIRKGEKVHECLITFEESRFLADNNYYYVLSPLDEAKTKFNNWAYYTDTNEWQLTKEEIKELIHANNL